MENHFVIPALSIFESNHGFTRLTARISGAISFRREHVIKNRRVRFRKDLESLPDHDALENARLVIGLSLHELLDRLTIRKIDRQHHAHPGLAVVIEERATHDDLRPEAVDVLHVREPRLRTDRFGVGPIKADDRERHRGPPVIVNAPIALPLTLRLRGRSSPLPRVVARTVPAGQRPEMA